MHKCYSQSIKGTSAESCNYYLKNDQVSDPQTNWGVNGYFPRNGDNGSTIAICSDYNTATMTQGIALDDLLA